MDDLNEYTSEVSAQYPEATPLFLGGQSMGGLIVLLGALRTQGRLSGIVLTSAAVDVEWTPMLKCAAYPAYASGHPNILNMRARIRFTAIDMLQWFFNRIIC